jgi:hypothetical protein
MLVKNHLSSSLAYEGSNAYLMTCVSDSPHMTPDHRTQKTSVDLQKSCISPLPLFELEEMASSKLFSPLKSNTEPVWMADKRLTRSKVYMARFHKAATVLQKYARLFSHRGGLHHLRRLHAAPRMQALVRGHAVRKLYRKMLAAKCIQKIARGWYARRWHRVTVLTVQLEKIESDRKQALADIVEWKEKQRKKIHKEHAKEVKEVELRLASIQAANETIASIRTENKKLRNQNDRLAEGIVALTKENAELEKNLVKMNEQRDELKQRIKELETKIPQYVKILQNFMSRKTTYKTSVDDRKEYFQFEQKARHIFLDTVSEMLRHIHDQCKDAELVEFVTNLALDGTEGFEE